MCRSTLSVDHDGRIYDCDFNLAIELDAGGNDVPRYFWDVTPDDLHNAEIAMDSHCQPAPQAVVVHVRELWHTWERRQSAPPVDMPTAALPGFVMNIIKNFLLIAVLLSPSLSHGVEITPPPAPATKINPELLGQSGLKLASPFWQKAMWEDGLAEVNTYALSQVPLWHQVSGNGTLIAVRETMDPSRAVKSRDGSGVPVIKAMLQRHFVTGSYPYHQSATALIGREHGVIQRYLMSSMEWCGNAGKAGSITVQ